jgi:hypothetical protein
MVPQILEVSSSITFDQSVLREFPAHASNEIEFFSIARTNLYFVDLESEITFGQTLDRNVELRPPVESIIRFDQHAGRGYVGTGSNSITFTQEVSRGDNLTSTVAFSHAVAETQGSAPPATQFGFEQSVTVQKEISIQVGNTIEFDQEVAGSVHNDCNEQRYVGGGLLPPVNMGTRSYITLTCSADSIDLRNPEFGNTEAPNVTRAYNTMRGGGVRTFRDSNRPDSTRITITVRMMSTTKVDELYAFLRACIGKEVTYTDQDNRTWTGIILNPDTAIATDRDGSCGPRTATIEMVMDP